MFWMRSKENSFTIHTYLEAWLFSVYFGLSLKPLNWSELGSWLRVLMGETSTPKPPEGLEGYMEETHQYHDIKENTASSDQESSTNSQVSINIIL